MAYKPTYGIRTGCAALALVFLSCASSVAGASPTSSDTDPEAFKIEVTGSAWLVDSSGTIQASGTPIDLRSDLGAAQQQPSFFGRLVVKPGRKHRIIVEGTPIRLSGYNTVDRDIVYRGQTFLVNETVRSSADLNYLFAGYQYDFVSGSMGHLGLSVGGAYADATGAISTVPTTAAGSASKSETVGLPLAGAEGRVFPIRDRKILEVEGGIRGMAVGSYGSYLEASASGGVNVGHFALTAGYRMSHFDLHQASSTNPQGVDIRLKGPIFSLQFRR